MKNPRIVTWKEFSQRGQESLPGPTAPQASWIEDKPATAPLASEYCQPIGSQAPPPASHETASKIPLSIPLCSIPNLPMAEVCQQTLERVWKEFEPIARRRNYNVKSVSELCCCGDGLDSKPGRRRKLRKQSNNVLGYNQTTFLSRGKNGKKSHTIHLRLRHPGRHTTQLLPWEDVAGTMAHELSHCVHQNHSAAFYKLMEELLEEHAQLQVESMGGLIYGHAPTAPVPSTTDPGRRLGGNSTNSGGGAGASRLLNDSTNSSFGNVGKRLGGSVLTPAARREAMAAAAETRRRRMERLKRLIEKSREPCVIEIQDDDDDIYDNNYIDAPIHSQGKPDKKRPTRGFAKKPVQDTKQAAVDLTGAVKRPKPTPSVNHEMVVLVDGPLPPAQPSNRPTPQNEATIDLTSPSPKRTQGATSNKIPPAPLPSRSSAWACPTCTYQNTAMVLQCKMCHAQRPANAPAVATVTPPPDNDIIELLD